MSISSDEDAAEGNVDHGMRDVDAALVITHEAWPSHHPSKGSLDNLATRQSLEAFLVVGATNDDEIEIGGLVHQLELVVGSIGEEMLHPGPALADRLRTGDQNMRSASLAEIRKMKAAGELFTDKTPPKARRRLKPWAVSKMQAVLKAYVKTHRP